MITRLISLVALLWTLGFAAFLLMLPRPLENVKTDAIVVPTGGAGRIDRGLALLKLHAAQRMLVTGVAPEVRMIDLAHEYPGFRATFACCVDLGREAVDTRSNAAETADWVREHNYRSVRLVTSDWHVARARLELTHALDRDVVVRGDGVAGAPRFGLLWMEYNKLLLRGAAMLFGIAA